MNIFNIFSQTKKQRARLRFAPSPTGFLHLGNFRTALFGYLLAKSLKGDFILRLEDTDQKREVEGALEKLQNILDWAQVKFDEGPHLGGKYGPYVQTERLDIYSKYTKELLEKGEAYHCFCSEERLADMRAKQEADKLPPRYDRLCRNLSKEEVEKRIANGEKYVIRQKMPLEGEISVYDEIRGEIKFKAADFDDHVLIKSNGVPTYHFASVVDDHLMKITHVTRGDEWLPSFPKNILLYKSFSWTPPKFIHLPLILNKEGGKLSKRQGDVFLEQYKDKGYLPEAIINFSALLGWHGTGEQEIYSLEELKNNFKLERIGASPAIFDLEKLDYYNAYYIRQKNLDELFDLLKPYLPIDMVENKSREEIKKFINLAKDRMKKLSDAEELTSFLFKLPEYEKELLLWKNLNINEIKNNLNLIQVEFDKITKENWTKEKLEEYLLNWLKDSNRKNGDFLWPLRVSLSGLKNSPSPFEIADAIGKDESLSRIKIALNKIEK